MGLDMFAFRHKGERLNRETNFEELAEDNKPEEISYWRKHNRLQGWFENLYYKKHDGEDLKWDSFNNVPLYLSRDDLMKLREEIKNKTLPETTGFFFGGDSYQWDKNEVEEQMKYDLDFIKQAIESIDKGYKVFYECSW